MGKNMTVKEALELAIAALDACKYGGAQQAAEVLRNGSAKVEKSELCNVDKCNVCNAFQKDEMQKGVCYNCERFYCIYVAATKTYTEHEEIRIVTVKSKPVFEKVEETR